MKIYFETEQDVTEILGIKQYEATMDVERDEDEHRSDKAKIYPRFLMKMKWFRKLVLPKKQNRGFPDFISKTDETRIQNTPFYLKNKNEWVVTEKIDGQSGTFFLKRSKSKHFWQKDSLDFGVCSRNLRLWKEDNSSYWTVAKKYDIKNKLVNSIGNSDLMLYYSSCFNKKRGSTALKLCFPSLLRKTKPSLMVLCNLLLP